VTRPEEQPAQSSTASSGSAASSLGGSKFQAVVVLASGGGSGGRRLVGSGGSGSGRRSLASGGSGGGGFGGRCGGRGLWLWRRWAATEAGGAALGHRSLGQWPRDCAVSARPRQGPCPATGMAPDRRRGRKKRSGYGAAQEAGSLLVELRDEHQAGLDRPAYWRRSTRRARHRARRRRRQADATRPRGPTSDVDIADGPTRPIMSVLMIGG